MIRASAVKCANATAAAVATLIESTPGAIGYCSLGWTKLDGIELTELTLDGVTADRESVESGAYRVVRPLGFVVSRPVPALQRFIIWSRSMEASSVMTGYQYAPYGQ